MDRHVRGKAMKRMNGTAMSRLAALALVLVLWQGVTGPSHAWDCTRRTRTLPAENVSEESLTFPGDLRRIFPCTDF